MSFKVAELRLRQALIPAAYRRAHDRPDAIIVCRDFFDPLSDNCPILNNHIAARNSCNRIDSQKHNH